MAKQASYGQPTAIKTMYAAARTSLPFGYEAKIDQRITLITISLQLLPSIYPYSSHWQ
jgi:hypothetical protein